jgi:hypothetical protein
MSRIYAYDYPLLDPKGMHLGGYKITNMGAPDNDQDAVNLAEMRNEWIAKHRHTTDEWDEETQTGYRESPPINFTDLTISGTADSLISFTPSGTATEERQLDGVEAFSGITLSQSHQSVVTDQAVNVYASQTKYVLVGIRCDTVQADANCWFKVLYDTTDLIAERPIPSADFGKQVVCLGVVTMPATGTVTFKLQAKRQLTIGSATADQAFMLVI